MYNTVQYEIIRNSCLLSRQYIYKPMVHIAVLEQNQNVFMMLLIRRTGYNNRVLRAGQWAGRRGHRERGVWPSDVGWPEHPLPLCLHRLPFHHTHPNPRGGREDTITKIDIKNNLVYMLSPISCCYYKIININTITIT